MNRSLRRFLWALSLVLAASSTLARAADGESPASTEPGEECEVNPQTGEIDCNRPELHYDRPKMFTEDWFNKTKQPVEWFSWGADLRLRGIWDKNLTTRDEGANNERFWHRYRTRWWGTVNITEDLDLNVGLAWEWRVYCRPKGDLRDTTLDEAIIEKLNVEWRNIGGLPLSARVGRQNITGLNDWLLFEGTPLDGSRTIFHDAARLTWEIKEFQTIIDGIYIDNAADPSDRIKPINDRDRHLIEHNERGGVLYVRNTSIERTQIEGYFIVKHDMGSDAYPNSDRTTYTMGARVKGNIDEARHWAYDVQIAQQVGHEEGQNICAGAAVGQLFYYFQDDWKNTIRMGYEYRSGDDPSTGHKEAFDNLWGRYPTFSNIYQGYTDTMEGVRPADLANLHRVQLGWSFAPMGNANHEICTDYHLLLADQNTLGQTGLPAGGSGPRLFSKSGNIRGHMLTSVWKAKWTEHISSHLIGEVLFPGDYYTDEKNEPVFFLRYEIVFSW
ncbi:MAG: alginate export family protein [Phycisphaerae bacterium]